MDVEATARIGPMTVRRMAELASAVTELGTLSPSATRSHRSHTLSVPAGEANQIKTGPAVSGELGPRTILFGAAPT